MLTTPAVMRMDVMDPELDAFLPFIPKADLTDPVAARKQLAELAAAAPSEVTAAAAPGTEGMEVEDRTVPAAPEVPVRIYRPSGAHGAIIWLRGGGWVVGDLDTEHPTAARLAGASGAVVISVDYRQAPEHRFPAALDDVYAVLEWTTQNAADLGIAPDRIAVGGHSAGAGLAAGAALRARDEEGPPIRFQLLNQPALDDRQETWSQRNFTDTPGRTATASPRYGGTTWATLPRPRTPLLPAPTTCPACHRRTCRPRSSTRSATRTSVTRCACSRRASRSNCTSGPGRSTARTRSRPTCRNGRSPNSAPPYAAPWPSEATSERRSGGGGRW